MLNRRRLLRVGQGAALAALLPKGAFGQETITLPFEGGERPLVRYPQKRPLLGLTARPPQLETPFAAFDEGPLTANDAFFVRYHLAGSPPEIDAEAWRLEVGGLVDRPLSLSIADLKRDFTPIEYVAVLQCSGNSRGFSRPRVVGGQSGHGNMGAARWRGVPLKAILERAGVRAGAVQIAFDGADMPPAETIPDFVKALEVGHALDGEVMLAYAMNGEDLPVLNGHPLRLVVPGWYGTYWMKHLTGVTVLDTPADTFWMKTAYRIPDTECACVPAGTAPAATVPINRLNIRSFITNLESGARIAAGQPVELRGIAFDGGSGIRSVEISTDGGRSWTAARLGDDLGRYAFRPWTASASLAAGEHMLQVRAISNQGEVQPANALWNPAGYMRNVIESIPVTAA